MAAQFPGALVTTTQLPNNRTDATTSATNHITDHNNAADEIIAIETELGTNPSAAHTDVATGMAAIMGRWIPAHFAYLNLTVPAAGVYGGHYSVTEDELITVASLAGLKQNFIYLNPADYAVTGYTMKMRVIMSWSQNTTAMGSTSMTAGLYPYIGGSATTAWTATVGSVVSGSTAQVLAASAGASTEGRIISSTFTAPAADAYILAVDVVGASPAGSTRLNVRLEYAYA
jgi:hypothetical protein